MTAPVCTHHCQPYSSRLNPDSGLQTLQALRRADQVESAEDNVKRDWYAPIVADAEAGFGGVLNAFELMKVCGRCFTLHLPFCGCNHKYSCGLTV